MSKDSPEVLVVVVIEEAGGAVEKEGWEVGGTADDEKGVADSAAIGGNDQLHSTY